MRYTHLIKIATPDQVVALSTVTHALVVQWIAQQPSPPRQADPPAGGEATIKINLPS